MFIGYQGKLKAFVAGIREELENKEFVQFTNIEEVPFAEMYNGVIYNNEEELMIAKQNYVRSIRNNYLVEYVDGAVSNPLRWADMSQELKDMYTNYRLYLVNYTEKDNWWKQNPLTLDEWKENSN